MARAYYNEIDAGAAEWLRELIKAGHIAAGDVDTRSVADVRPGDLAGYTQCHFFAGIGGWSAALRLAGVPDSFPVWTGSCPCQPGSQAGKRKGFADDRHLWPAWFNLIRERRPAIVFGEQVAAWAQWIGLVRGDLEAVEYAVGCMPVEAASAGADHLRDRFWFVAHRMADTSGNGRQQSSDGLFARQSEPSRINQVLRTSVAYAERERLQEPSFARSHSRTESGGPRRGAPERCGDVGDTDSGRWAPGLPAATTAGHRNSALTTGRSDVGYAIGERWPTRRRDYAEHDGAQLGAAGEFEWVACADGKARRVKSGIQLLAHGVFGRVGLLRGFGNAIDLRPASVFIRSALDAIGDVTTLEPAE